jgi:hypothetical protein
VSKTANASRRVKFEITPRDIARAKRKDPHHCAAALALKRALGADDVEVRASRVFVEKNGRRTRYEPSGALRFEALTLDRGGKFEPGEYEIKPVPPSQSPKAMAKKNRINRNRPKSRKIIHRRETPNIRGSARGLG